MHVPWEEKTIEKTREEFVKRALSKEKSKSTLCREYNISRPTGDKWIQRYLEGEGLANHSRRPFHCPNRTSPDVEAQVLALRDQYPALGAAKLKRILENSGQSAPAQSTINGILKRNGRISEAASQGSTPYKRFVRENPNDLWQVDFKGDFALGNRQRCHPLTMIDDHSRFCLCIDAKEGQRRDGVLVSFQRVFDAYGLPDTLLCDNGNPWGTPQSVGYTLFEVWLMDQGVLTIHCRPRHPQTQGKDERFNGTLKRELLKFQCFEDISEAQLAFDAFRQHYNEIRPHHALHLDVPSSHYQPSTRSYQARTEKWLYPADCDVRNVKHSGYLTFKGQGYFISEAFGERTVGIKESSKGKGIFNVFYRQFRIARVDVDERVVISRKPVRYLPVDSTDL